MGYYVPVSEKKYVELLRSLGSEVQSKPREYEARRRMLDAQGSKMEEMAQNARLLADRSMKMARYSNGLIGKQRS